MTFEEATIRANLWTKKERIYYTAILYASGEWDASPRYHPRKPCKESKLR